MSESITPFHSYKTNVTRSVLFFDAEDRRIISQTREWREIHEAITSFLQLKRFCSAFIIN